jgi:toxin-antitoxin system PIN domain toxin
MPGFTTSFLFPDINVWVALAHSGHVHHDVASDWFSTLDDDTRLHFCRITQLGFLRLLTAQAVMGDDVLTQPEAWLTYDHWFRDSRVAFIDEPVGVDRRFRAATRRKSASPKVWADAYLLAFAETAQLSLVTFDQAFKGRSKHVLLLSE